MERGQFTFYGSFFKAIQRIRKKSAQADAYRAICAFALQGIEPVLEDLDDAAAIAVEMALPILRAANLKAAGGAKGRKPKDMAKTMESCGEDMPNKNKDKEKDKEKDKVKNKSLPEGGVSERAFEIFWSVYPKKVGLEQARKAFAEVQVPVEELVRAVKQQTQSAQWSKDGGQYIPNAATWLSQQRWEDKLPLPAEKGVPMGVSGELGQAELENIQRLLRETDSSLRSE